MTYHVYTLCHPATGDVYYVGLTIAPTIRILGHLYAGRAEGKSSAKDVWVRSLLDQDLRPVMLVIEAHSDPFLAEIREAFWISFHAGSGLLTNTHMLTRKLTNPKPKPVRCAIPKMSLSAARMSVSRMIRFRGPEDYLLRHYERLYGRPHPQFGSKMHL